MKRSHPIRHSQRETVAVSSLPSSRNRSGVLDDGVDSALTVGDVEGVVGDSRSHKRGGLQICIPCRCRAYQENQEAPDSDARFTGFHCPQFRQRVSLDDMEQLLRSPLEEFDLAAEDWGGNSDLGAALPHEQSNDDTKNVEWSLQGDSEDTVFLK